MKRDDHLIFESIVSKYSDTKPITNYAIKQLEKMHEQLNGLSTAIELARQPEIDQVLSKIRDLADMLISDSKHAEGEETGNLNKQEDEEDISKSPFHYDPMHGLEKAAHEIKDTLKSAANDEARTEHIEKMAEIILGPQSEYASVGEYRRILSGVIELLKHYVMVEMN
jgi:hypothetical protein